MTYRARRALAYVFAVALIVSAGIVLAYATGRPAAPTPCSVTTEPGDWCLVRLAPLPAAEPSRKD